MRRNLIQECRQNPHNPGCALKSCAFSSMVLGLLPPGSSAGSEDNWIPRTEMPILSMWRSSFYLELPKVSDWIEMILFQFSHLSLLNSPQNNRLMTWNWLTPKLPSTRTNRPHAPPFHVYQKKKTLRNLIDPPLSSLPLSRFPSLPPPPPPLPSILSTHTTFLLSSIKSIHSYFLRKLNLKTRTYHLFNLSISIRHHLHISPSYTRNPHIPQDSTRETQIHSTLPLIILL